MNKVAHIPDSMKRYRLVGARLPVCLAEAAGSRGRRGRARRGHPPDRRRAASPRSRRDMRRLADTAPALHLGGGLVLPAFVDIHTHLDKGHIWPRQRNRRWQLRRGAPRLQDGPGELERATICAPACALALQCAYAHGTAAIRTHINSIEAQTRISWPVFAELADEWRGRVALEGSPLFSIDRALDDSAMTDIEWAMRECGAMLGAVTYMMPELEAGARTAFPPRGAKMGSRSRFPCRRERGHRRRAR